MSELDYEFIIPNGAQYQDIEYCVGNVRMNRHGGGLYYKINDHDMAYYFCGHDWLKSSKSAREVRGFCKVVQYPDYTN